MEEGGRGRVKVTTRLCRRRVIFFTRLQAVEKRFREKAGPRIALGDLHCSLGECMASPSWRLSLGYDIAWGGGRAQRLEKLLDGNAQVTVLRQLRSDDAVISCSL